MRAPRPASSCPAAAVAAGVFLAAAAAPAAVFCEVDGVVSMEAEHFTLNKGYTVRTDDGPDGKAAGWSGEGWIFSETKTPRRLDYEVVFKNAGTYYVHFRTLAGYDGDWKGDVSGIDNGYHAEFDGKSISGRGIYVVKTKRWTWYARPQHGEKTESISFEVPSPGRHTFSIIGREALSRLDKIVIHSGVYGAEARPDIRGEGPAETTLRAAGRARPRERAAALEEKGEQGEALERPRRDPGAAEGTDAGAARAAQASRETRAAEALRAARSLPCDDPARRHEALRRVAAAYPGTQAAAEAACEAESLRRERGDEIESGLSEREAARLLRRARNFGLNGMDAEARGLLRRILDDYPETAAAKEARAAIRRRR